MARVMDDIIVYDGPGVSQHGRLVHLSLCHLASNAKLSVLFLELIAALPEDRELK